MGEFSVELAPNTVDLNSLLGMTDDELNAIASSTSDLPDVIEDENISEPHITVSTKKLIEVLKVSSLVSSAGENSFEGKNVVIKSEDGIVRFLLSDNKRNIEKRVEISNKENSFNAFLAFSTSTLVKMATLCESAFTIIEHTNEDGSKHYCLKVVGGEMHLDNIKMSEDKYVKDFNDKTITQFKRENVLIPINRLYNFASTSIKTGKNLDFMGNTVQAQPINSLAKVTVDEELPNFRMSLTDAKILYMLAMDDDSSTIGISSDGKIFSGNKYNFKTESYQTSDCVFDSVVERMFNGEYATVDVGHLTKVTNLSVGLDVSLGEMKFNYSKQGRVEVELMTKRENSVITLEGSTNEDLIPLEVSSLVPSNNLKGAMSVFQSEVSLNLRVSNDGISMESGNVRVAVLGKNAGK